MNLGFLASGRGSNLQAILDACADGTIAAEPKVLIVNNSQAPVADRARAAGLVVRHLSSHTHPDPDVLDKEICSTLLDHEVDLVALCGYMKKLGPQTLDAFANRVLNVHAGLLPKYGGQGMYGMAALRVPRWRVARHLGDDRCNARHRPRSPRCGVTA